jgi:hypothetical protein
MTTIRRFTMAAAASVCMLAGLLTAASVPAQAQVTHDYLPGLSEKLSENIPSKGPHGKEIALPGTRTLEPSAVTVDSGHLWVYESTPSYTDGRIDEYDSSTGAFIGQIPHAPAHSGTELSLTLAHLGSEADLYVSGFVPEDPVSVYSESGTLKASWTGAGTPAGTFASQQGGVSVSLAADNSINPADERKGDVYAAVPGERVVDIFRLQSDGEEHYVGQITGVSPSEPFSSPDHIAVNQINGDLVVLDGSSTEQVIDILEPVLGGYALVHRIPGPPSGGAFQDGLIAVGGGNAEIYVSTAVENKGPQGESLSENLIYQFSAAGTFLGQFTGAALPKGKFGLRYSLAVGPASEVFVTEQPGSSEGRVDAFGPNIVFPDVTTGTASNVGPFTATLNGVVDPDEAGPATCRFQWGTSRSFGQTVACEPETVTNGNSPVAVHANLKDLQADTTYFYRLEATNANGTNPGSPEQDHEFTTHGPGLRDASVTDVASTSATFDATIDPHGAPASYYFQYGTTTAYGSDVPVPPGEAIGAGEGDVEVAPHHVQGLASGTVYHYRLVVISEAVPGEAETYYGPDEVFTTQTATVSELPDGRHWEMVSPPDKQGARLQPILENGVEQAASGGGVFAYLADIPTEQQPEGNTNKVQVLSTRGPEGWSTRDIALPHPGFAEHSVGLGEEYRFFSQDLTQAVVQPPGLFDPALSPEASEQTAMLRTFGPECGKLCYRPLVTGKAGYANVPPGTVFGEEPEETCESLYCGPKFISATPDLHHILVNIESLGLMAEWTNGALTPVGTRGYVLGDQQDERGALSLDGSRVILTEPTTGDIFMRDVPREKTIQLNVAEAACAAELKCSSGGGEFQVASADGAKVFFTNVSGGRSHRLLKSSGDAGSDLYECEMVEAGGELQCRLSDIAREALGVLGASEDGSYLYFVAESVLTEGAAAGEPNLYVDHDGAIELVTTLSQADLHDWANDVRELSARVSPDGGWAEFMSQRSLTGYDNLDAVSGKPDAEVYLYSAAQERLVCASCNRTGARPTGVQYASLEPGNGGLTGGPRGVWQSGAWVAANVPGWTQFRSDGSADQPRYLSDSGRLFFNSGDALVPQDVNGTEDVYEYEPPGVGSCTAASVTFSERSGGCVGLISAGTSAEESGFLEAGESGGDVFFLTFSKLQPQDYDNALDVYDAHECMSTTPCYPTPVPTPAACATADACRAAPTPQPPIFGDPSSATFSGAGNVSQGSGGESTATPKKKSLTRAQKLTKALKACRKKPKRKRPACAKRARARYGAARRTKHAVKGKPAKKGKR